jgi:hypothetical protein
MSTSNQSANIVQVLRRIPPKWAAAIIGIVLVYWLTQPLINRTFGWNLPSIVSLIGEEQPSLRRPNEEPVSPVTAEASEKPVPIAKREGPANTKIVEPSKPKQPESKPTTSGASTPSKNLPTSKASSTSKTTPAELAELARKAGVNGSSDKTYGFLQEIGKDRYRSPAGLVYGRGSEEGHRLKHLERHLADQPTRPGPHGVFDGDMPQVLRWIDEAYSKALKGDRMAKKYKEDDSTVYEFTFSKPIGYMGGSAGKRKNNPSVQSIRIVARGQDLITAFPF